MIRQWDIRGKCDGLTADPATGQVIATVNEDANSSLYSIDPWTGQVDALPVQQQPLPHHGGTDAISFYNGQMLISASAPGTTGAAAPNPAYPAVYSVTLDPLRPGGVRPRAVLRRVLGHRGQRPAAWASRSGWPSPTPTPTRSCRRLAARFAGDFMLTSQGDKEQIYVHGPGTWYQHLSVLALSQSVDDTAWATILARDVLTAPDNGADTVDVDHRDVLARHRVRRGHPVRRERRSGHLPGTWVPAELPGPAEHVHRPDHAASRSAALARAAGHDLRRQLTDRSGCACLPQFGRRARRWRGGSAPRRRLWTATRPGGYPNWPGW